MSKYSVGLVSWYYGNSWLTVSLKWTIFRWVHHGEESIAFRVSSWKDQRGDQKDGNIATGDEAQFMAFVTGKSVNNRRNFAQQLRKAAPTGHFTSIGFLQGMYSIVCKMHSPCMRLELLQYILALDNRYSVELIKDSIELAAACLSVVAKNWDW